MPESSKAIALPDRSQTVTLSTAAGGRIPARVLERGPSSLLVAIMVPTRPFSDSELAGLVLEFTGARGRVRLTGAATVEDAGEPDVLRIQELRSIEVLQEREYVRIKVARPVIVYAGRDDQVVQSYTVDVSGGGFLLAGPDTLRIGEKVSFRLTLTPGETPVTGTGRVARFDTHGRRGIAFAEISELDRRRLVRFIFECQRAERRRGLEQEDGRGG